MSRNVRAAENRRQLASLASTSDADRFATAMALIAKTHESDARDVREGRLAADQLGFFSRKFVKSLKLHFPDKKDTRHE